MRTAAADAKEAVKKLPFLENVTHGHGHFPDEVVRVAHAATDPGLPFETFAAALLLAGLSREVDVNLLGVVERHPKQPTLEVRCLPGSLDADELLARLEAADALVASFGQRGAAAGRAAGSAR